MPRVVDHEARRHELLDGAFVLFAERGYAALTMRALASELAVSTGTLYHYFPGKQALFSAMVERIAARDVARITSMVPASADLSTRVAGLMAFIELSKKDLQRAVLVALDYQRQQDEDASTTQLAGALEAYHRVIGDALGGTDPTLPPVLMSMFIGALVQGMILGEIPAAHGQAISALLRAGASPEFAAD